MANLGSLYATLELNTADLKKRVSEVERRMDTFTKRTKDTTSKIGTAIKGFIVGVVIAAVTKAIQSTIRGLQDLFNTAREFDRLKNTFTQITGSAERMGREFDFVRDVARRTGQNFYNMIEGYKGILAASRGTNLEGAKTRDIFEGIAKAAASLGLTKDQVQGALRAIEQMISKGNVQAEELRGQLGERLPGAFQLAAEAMGKTTQELNKMLDNGEVLAEDLLPKLAQVLKDKYSGEVTKAVEASNKFQEAWTELKLAMTEGGFLDDIADSMIRFSEIMKDPSVQEGLKSIIGLLGSAAKAMGNLAQSAAGWAAVGRGELSFFKFATMNAEELNKWLKQNRTDTSKLANEIAVLNNKISQEYNKAFFVGSEADKARHARIQKYRDEIKALQMQYDAAINKNAYGGMFDGLNFDEITNSIQEVKKELSSPMNNLATLEGFAATVKEMNKTYEEAAKERIDIYDEEKKEQLEAEKNSTEAMIKYWASVNNERIASQQEALKKMKEEALTFENFMKEHGKRIGRSIASGLTNALFDFVEGTKSAKDAFLDFAKSFLRQIAQMILQQTILNALKNSSYGEYFGAAKGAVLNNGNVTKMAKGGLITKPTFFANGGVLAGEAGTESIMPLKRDSQGRLGVYASGGDSKGYGNFVVKIENRTDNQIKASSATAQQTPDGMILNVVIDAYRNNTNSFRDIIGR